jgi:hypothetical protein
MWGCGVGKQLAVKREAEASQLAVGVQPYLWNLNPSQQQAKAVVEMGI